MAVILRELVANYKYLINEYGDKRTVHWPFQASPWPTVSIIAFYLWFVKIGGPAYMKNRRPYNIDWIIQAYNIFQVIACGIISFRTLFLTYSPWGRYNLSCEPLDFTDDEFNRQVLYMSYSFYIMKKVDLLDTVFFILRKKFSQASFLHIYHHVLMILVTWTGMRMAPNGHSAYIIVVNSFVHSVMYLYYFITNWRQEYKSNVWWKKYITQLQLVQFMLLLYHYSKVVIFSRDCAYPNFIVLINIPQNLFILLMFADFYRKAYLSKPSTGKHTEIPKIKK